jgi:hypothetical protein
MLKGLPMEILHYRGEVVMIICAAGNGVSSLLSKSTDGVRRLGILSRVPILYWIGCSAVILNAMYLVFSIVTGRCEK